MYVCSVVGTYVDRVKGLGNTYVVPYRNIIYW